MLSSGVRLSVELGAILFHVRDDMSAARHYNVRSNPHRAPHHFMRSFIDAGEEIRQLLHSVVSGHLVDGAALGYAQDRCCKASRRRRRGPRHQLKRQPSGACAQVSLPSSRS